MANTKYAKATGGTPIISWIPNQITAVLNYMSDVIDLIPTGTKHLNKSSYLDSINKKKDLLNKILKDFNVCHIHPNNCCGVHNFENLDIPSVLEITFLRKDLVKSINKISLTKIIIIF